METSNKLEVTNKKSLIHWELQLVKYKIGLNNIKPIKI
jgi:hypothetical protein